MTRRILVLFPDEWDRAAAHDPRLRSKYEFLYEGFDLFSFPDNARLFAFDALKFVDRIAARYARAPLDAIVTSDEQFGPFAQTHHVAEIVCLAGVKVNAHAVHQGRSHEQPRQALRRPGGGGGHRDHLPAPGTVRYGRGLQLGVNIPAAGIARNARCVDDAVAIFHVRSLDQARAGIDGDDDR